MMELPHELQRKQKDQEVIARQEQDIADREKLRRSAHIDGAKDALLERIAEARQKLLKDELAMIFREKDMRTRDVLTRFALNSLSPEQVDAIPKMKTTEVVAFAQELAAQAEAAYADKKTEAEKAANVSEGFDNQQLTAK